MKTVKYFRSIERVQEEVERTQAELKKKAVLEAGASGQQVGSME